MDDNPHVSPTASPVYIKKLKLYRNWANCGICQKKNGDSLCLIGVQGLETLLNAALIKCHYEFHAEVASANDSGIDIYYHKSCYTSYTSQVNLGRYDSQSDKSNEHNNGCTRVTRSETSPINYGDTCMICMKKVNHHKRYCTITDQKAEDRV